MSDSSLKKLGYWDYAASMPATPAPQNDPGRLSLDQRRADLQRMAAETFDVVVIGGGSTGTGAASRGAGGAA
jgi:hypothetical protein